MPTVAYCVWFQSTGVYASFLCLTLTVDTLTLELSTPGGREAVLMMEQ